MGLLSPSRHTVISRSISLTDFAQLARSRRIDLWAPSSRVDSRHRLRLQFNVCVQRRRDRQCSPHPALCVYCIRMAAHPPTPVCRTTHRRPRQRRVHIRRLGRPASMAVGWWIGSRDARHVDHRATVPRSRFARDTCSHQGMCAAMACSSSHILIRMM